MRLREFERRLQAEGLGKSYEAAHARLAIDTVTAAGRRGKLIESGQLKPLPDNREAAADRTYLDTATKVCDGLEAVLKSYGNSASQRERKIYAAWERNVH
jgi:hypothetical protein